MQEVIYMTLIQRGQCYAHVTATKYFEIRSVFLDISGLMMVHFIYYDSKDDQEHYASRSYSEMAQLIERGTLIRD